MSKYTWVRKPDFKSITKDVKYNDYWGYRGWSINKKLKNREKLALKIIPSGASVIDLGCGNSLLPVSLKEKGANVHVGDISDKVLEGYKAYGIEGKVVDLEKINPDALGQKFDYMILFEVLEHLRFPEETIEALKNSADNFIITVPNSAAYYYRFSLLFKGRFFTQWAYHPSEHLRYWSHIDFMDWLDAMGFQVVMAQATDGMTIRGWFPRLPNLWKNFLADRVLYHCIKK